MLAFIFWLYQNRVLLVTGWSQVKDFDSVLSGHWSPIGIWWWWCISWCRCIRLELNFMRFHKHLVRLASESFSLPVVGVEIELELVENRYCLSQQLLLVTWLVELELGLGKLFEHVLLHLLWLWRHFYISF